MNRRDLLTSSIGLGVLAVASAAHAQGKPAAPPAPPAAAKKPDARGDLLAALADCQRTGEECVAHCAAELARGNKEMANCNQRVHEMLAMTRPMLSMVALESSQARALAALCAQTCKACKEACGEHRAHFAHGMHGACKACMEACERCESACKAFAA